MKNTMIDYMGTIAKDDFESELHLLEHKFKKLRTLFHMMSKYSDDIEDIVENDSDDSVLDCSIIFTSAKIAKKVMDHVPTPYRNDTPSYEISVDKAVINIVLTESESEISDKDS